MADFFFIQVCTQITVGIDHKYKCTLLVDPYLGENNKETSDDIQKGKGTVSQQAEHLHQTVRPLFFFLLHLHRRQLL